MQRRGEISPGKAFRKTEKALAESLARTVLLERDLERREATEQLDKAARGSGKKRRFSQEHLFDQDYRDQHAESLAKRKREEEQRREEKKRTKQARGLMGASKFVQQQIAGPSTVTEEI